MLAFRLHSKEYLDLLMNTMSMIVSFHPCLHTSLDLILAEDSVDRLVVPSLAPFPELILMRFHDRSVIAFGPAPMRSCLVPDLRCVLTRTILSSVE